MSDEEPPLLDLTVLERLVEGGGPELPAELAGLFGEDGPGFLARIQEAQDPGALARAAHALKGSCASLGLVRLAAACAEIERSARAGAMTDVNGMDELFARSLQALERAVASR